jgi:sucrose-6-phosphatase
VPGHVEGRPPQFPGLVGELVEEDLPEDEEGRGRSTATHLLACDLDGTLIPTRDDDGARNRFRASLGRRGDGLLAYVTGRYLELALEGIETYGLPRPDWLVCNVGTSVHLWGRGGVELDQGYRAAVLREAGKWDADEIRRRLVALPGVELQEAPKQAEFKASFFFEGGEEGALGRHPRVEALAGGGHPSNLIWSEDPVTGRGLLDILPPGTAKGRAVDYLRRSAGLPLDRVIYAGDSGNDRDALLLGGLGILVANAPGVLRTELRREALRLGLADRLHFSTSPFADGVVEGVRHHRARLGF